MLLVLDDLQWSDALTVSLVGAALRDLTASPIMVLALARPEVVELFPGLWSPRLATIPLQPLGSAATARLIRQVLGAEISDDRVKRIVDRAGGNALYLEELIRAAEANRDAIPETVLAMLQARIGLLPAATRRVLRAASIFGENFPVAGIQALLGPAAQDEIQPSLAILAKHEILEPQADERGAFRWRFRHVLMRDAVYGLWTADDLLASHALAAEYLATSGEADAVIASHFERGGQPARAVRHYLIAAHQAFGRNDLAAVMALGSRGLACGAAGQDRGALLSIQAQAAFFQHDFAKSASASLESLQLLPAGHPMRVQSLASAAYAAVHLGKGVEAEAQVEELLVADPIVEHRASYLRALGDMLLSHVALGQRGPAVKVLTRMMTVDDQLGPADPLAHGHRLYFETRFHQILGDDPHRAWRLAEAGVRQYQRSGDRRMLAYTQVEVGECIRRLFSVDEGIAVMRQAVKLAHEINEPVTTAFVQQYLAKALAEHGTPAQLPEAHALAQEVMELSGTSVYRAFGAMALALTELREGHLGSALQHARDAQAKVQTMGLRSFFPHTDAVVVQVLMRAGDTASATALAEQARAFVEENHPLGLIELSVRLVLVRAQVQAGRRADAARAISLALARLGAQARLIPDPGLRQRFVTEVPEHAGLRALAAELGVA